MAKVKSKTGTSAYGMKVRGSTSKSGGLTTQSTPKAGTPSFSGQPSTTITTKSTTLTSNIAGAGGLGTTALNTFLRSTTSTLKLPAMAFKRLPDSLYKNLNLVFKGDLINYGKTTVLNSEFRPISDAGVHEFRPEILSVLDFQPIWRPGSVTLQQDVVIRRNSDVGDMINFQYQTKQLRQETLLGLIKNIKAAAPQGKNPFIDIRNEYVGQMRNVQQTLNYIDSVIDNIELIKNSLEIKKIPPESYQVLENNVDTRIAPLVDYFNARMQYRKEQYDSFSETKILLQMFFDLQNMLENYSSTLLSITDNDRKFDYSPTVLDKTYTLQNAFTFDIKSYNESSVAINAGSKETFNKFINSLPRDPDQRIVLLTYLLSKEYLISNGLGDPTNLSFLNNVGITPDNGSKIFSNIIGDVGNTIFELPKTTNPNSLSSLLFIDTGDPNAQVLAFENKYIDSNDQKTLYVPGSAYFTDAIITVNGKSWNTKPYTDYVNRFNKVVLNNRTLLENLLKFNVFDRTGNTEGSSGGTTKTQPSNITPSQLNQKFIQAIYSSFDKLSADEESRVSAIGSLSTNNALKIVLESQQRNIQTALLRETDPDRVAALNRANARINIQLADLDVPQISNDVKISTDQALLMAMFNLASSGYSDLKLYLFQACILAGLVRNKDLNAGNIFTLLANTEIKTANEISQLLALSNIPTINGDLLSTVVDTFSRSVGREVSRILSEILNDSGRRPPGARELEFYVETNQIPIILSNCILGRGPSGNTNIISYFCNMAETIFDSAKINGVNVHLLTDGTNRTRYNRLSISTQLLFTYEILCQYSLKYTAIRFSNIRRVELPSNIVEPIVSSTDIEAIGLVSINLDVVANNLIINAFESIINPIPESDKPAKRQQNDFYSSLEDNQQRILGEVNGLRDGIGILRVINDNFQNASSKIQNFFNQTDLQAFLANSPISNLNLLQNFSQLRLSSYIFEDLKERTSITDSLVSNAGGDAAPVTNVDEKELIVSNAIVPSEYNSLVSMLTTTSKFLEAVPSITNPTAVIKRNNKIVTVGIPAGFSKQLADRVNMSDIAKQGLQDKQSDVVVINIYPGDLRFGELVLSPLKYIFDMSLFVTKKDMVDLNAVNGENYDDLVARIKISDLDNPFNINKIGLTDMLQDQKYNFLNVSEKADLIRNHVNSYLLGLYINFLTGLRLSEEVFLNPQDSGKILTPKTAAAAKNYISQMGEVPPEAYIGTEAILANPNLSDSVKDTYRLLTYGSLVFNTNEVNKLVTTPKLFDRTFNIPVNLNQLEIDEAATSDTESGREALNKKYYQKYMRRVPAVNSQGAAYSKLYLISDSISDFIVKNIFVSVETAIDTEAQDIQSAKQAAPTKTIGLNASLSTSIFRKALYNNPKKLT